MIRAWGVGTCVAHDDPKALAEGVRQMMEPKPYESAKAAVEIARDTLKWEHTAQLTWQAYLSILESAL